MIRYEDFGAHDVGGRIRFSVFIPGPDQYIPGRGGEARIASLEAYGTFQQPVTGQPWDLADAVQLDPEPFEGGTLYTATTGAVPDDFYEYKYRVSFEGAAGEPRIITDPCARYGHGENENSGVVVGGSRPADNIVTPLMKRLPYADLVIYELFLEDFTKEYRGSRSPVQAVLEKLDRIASLGFNAIEFMPWTAWVGGGFNWGYLPYQYYSVEHSYVADPNDFREQLSVLKLLISACHERGLHVIMDAVFNHVEIDSTQQRGFPYHWLWRNPADSPFTGQYEQGGYGEELDFHNRCTEEFVVGICGYWIDAFGIDGLRLDYTKGYYSGSAEHGLPKVIAGVRRHLAQSDDGERKDKFPIIIEHLAGWDAIDVTNSVDATSCWIDDGFWRTKDYLHGGLAPSIMRWLDSGSHFQPGRLPVMYIGNHDHETPTHVAGGRAAWHRLQPYLIALYTSYGIPLLYQTEDGGQDEWMPEDDTFTEVKRVTPRPKHWDLTEDGLGRWIGELLAKLAKIRREHPVLRQSGMYPGSWPWDRRIPYDNGYGIDADRQTVVYRRWGNDSAGKLHRYVIALNFGGFSQRLSVPFPDGGTWTDILGGSEVSPGTAQRLEQTVDGHWGYVFHRID
jgi:hypothetical protein